MELTTKQISILAHFKSEGIVAITLTNGVSHLYKVEEMNTADTEAFYEIS